MKTAINFLAQATFLAFVCLSLIGWLLYSYLVQALSISGLQTYRYLVQSSESAFVIFSLLVWLVSQIIMLVKIFKNNYKFHAWQKEYENNWIEVFYPVMLAIYFVFGFIVISIPGFFVSGLLNSFFSEDISLIANIAITVLLAAYTITRSKKA